MKKVFHILIALGLAIFLAGSLIAVLCQAVGLIIGLPSFIVTVEGFVEELIFPAISLAGLLCWIYGMIWPKKKKSE